MNFYREKTSAKEGEHYAVPKGLKCLQKKQQGNRDVSVLSDNDWMRVHVFTDPSKVLLKNYKSFILFFSPHCSIIGPNYLARCSYNDVIHIHNVRSDHGHFVILQP